MFNSVMLFTEGTIFLFVYFRTLMQGWMPHPQKGMGEGKKKGGTAKGEKQEEKGEQMDWCHQQPQGT